MALTRVSPALFQVSNNITSVTVGGSANTISLTFDSNGVITGASNNAVSVANTAITGNIISSQITSIGGSQITANTIANSAIQTGAVENYMNAQGLSFGMRNRIINGAMVIDQRNAGASVTVNSTTQTFSVDRWWASGQSTDGVFTMQQSSTAPSGFSNSTAITVTTADASIGTTQRYYFAQRIEGFNTADLGWGTAGASTVTLSFWVRSSVTGTFGGFIYNSAADYSYPFSYSISVANTWENKTVTIAGPTAGTWLGATNGIGIQIGWSLGTGTDRLGTAGSWSANQYFGATGQTNIIGTLNATFYITGVQLEKGSTATSFDYRPYGTELALCQRYLPAFSATTTTGPLPGIATALGTNVNFIFNHPVPARVQGTGVGYSSATHFNFSNNDGNSASTAVSFAAGSPNATQLTITVAVSRGATTTPGWFYTNNASAILYITGCEL